VSAGETVLVLSADQPSRFAAAQAALEGAIIIGDRAPVPGGLVHEVIDGRDVRLFEET
jgi:hypothetical protein